MVSGDPTLIRTSETLKFMFSRSGFSFGTSRVFEEIFLLKGGEGEVNEKSKGNDRRRNSTWCKDKFQTDHVGGFYIHKYVKDVRLGEKGGEEEEGYMQCFFTDAN